MKNKEFSSSEIQHETRSTQPVIAPGEIIIGTIIDIDGQGQPLVNYHGNLSEKNLPAMSTLGLQRKHVGRQVALLFANGDPGRPVIMGLIHSPLHELLETYEVIPEDKLTTGMEQTDQTSQDKTKIDDAMIDGRRIVLEGKEEIVLKCGAASITLTKAGKILIRGKYLMNRAEGVNRIMGGSVQVN